MARLSPKQQAYQDYINSRAWEVMRARVIARDGGVCRKCGCRGHSKAPLQVHHMTYARFGNERDEDLITLCKTCHKAVHAQQKQHLRGAPAKAAPAAVRGMRPRTGPGSAHLEMQARPSITPTTGAMT